MADCSARACSTAEPSWSATQSDRSVSATRTDMLCSPGYFLVSKVADTQGVALESIVSDGTDSVTVGY
jgi:hypothetical protein